MKSTGCTQDELASTIGKVDRAKQLLHFPAVDGYRFRSGSGGIFLGSKDLSISELAASFYLSCHRELGADGRPRVRISVALVRAKCVTEGTHGRQRACRVLLVLPADFVERDATKLPVLRLLTCQQQCMLPNDFPTYSESRGLQ